MGEEDDLGATKTICVVGTLLISDKVSPVSFLPQRIGGTVARGAKPKSGGWPGANTMAPSW